MRRTLIILSIVLQKQLVNAMGLKLPGSEWFLPGLEMGITTVSRKTARFPDVVIYLLREHAVKAEFGRWL